MSKSKQWTAYDFQYPEVMSAQRAANLANHLFENRLKEELSIRRGISVDIKIYNVDEAHEEALFINDMYDSEFV